jgi:hypothetical protein
VRGDAAQALGLLAKDNRDKVNAAIDPLIVRLGDGFPVVRRGAAQALGLLAKDNNDKVSAAIDALIARLGDGDSDVRSAAAQGLTGMPEPVSAPDIVALLGLAADRPLEAARMEAAFHILSGGDNKLWLFQPLLQRTQREAAHYRNPEATLALFVVVWPATVPFTELRQQVAWPCQDNRMARAGGASRLTG